MMHDDTAEEVGPPTQGAEGAEPESAPPSQALVAEVDGTAPSARRVGAGNYYSFDYDYRRNLVAWRR